MHAGDTAEFAIAGAADYQLTDTQFHRIRALVREHTGIALSDAKRQLVYGRLSRNGGPVRVRMAQPARAEARLLR